MAYTAWSVVAFEQPTAAKWNQLGENDAGLRDGSNVLWNNNQEIQAKNAAGTTKKFLRLDNDDYMRVSQLPFQQLTSNSTLEDVLIQTGFSFIQGNGTNTNNKTITFPTQFGTIYAVIIGQMGYTNNSDPTTILSPNVKDAGNIAPVFAVDVTTSNFVAYYTVDSSATLASTLRKCFSWMAIGTKA